MTDKSSWVKLLLNDGVDPVTNATVISRGTLEEVVSAHSIVDGNPRNRPERSIIGYGLGWTRFSYIGHDVRTSARFSLAPGPRFLRSYLPIASSPPSNHFARYLRDYDLSFLALAPSRKCARSVGGRLCPRLRWHRHRRASQRRRNATRASRNNFCHREEVARPRRITTR